jgi:hypothetical protein
MRHSPASTRASEQVSERKNTQRRIAARSWPDVKISLLAPFAKKAFMNIYSGERERDTLSHFSALGELSNYFFRAVVDFHMSGARRKRVCGECFASDVT